MPQEAALQVLEPLAADGRTNVSCTPELAQRINGSSLGKPHNETYVVLDREGHRAIRATEGAQIGHYAVAPQESMLVLVTRQVGITRDPTSVVRTAVAIAGRTAKSPQANNRIMNPAGARLPTLSMELKRNWQSGERRNCDNGFQYP